MKTLYRQGLKNRYGALMQITHLRYPLQLLCTVLSLLAGTGGRKRL
ncbi:hypothetical protein WDV93_20080 [Pantoea ananatis]